MVFPSRMSICVTRLVHLRPPQTQRGASGLVCAAHAAGVVKLAQLLTGDGGSATCGVGAVSSLHVIDGGVTSVEVPEALKQHIGDMAPTRLCVFIAPAIH